MYENEKYKNSPPTTPFLMSKKEKNSNFAVIEIANKFIAGLQFLAHILRKKNGCFYWGPKQNLLGLHWISRHGDFCL